jgi:deazaflavin-dependent oxidoreductase (nitroreductase family)
MLARYPRVGRSSGRRSRSGAGWVPVWQEEVVTVRTMGKLIVRILGVVAGVVAVAATVMVLGMRTGSPPVVDAVRRFNQRVGNPKQMKSAGTPGAYAGVIHHVGRSSGRAYETPVGPTATDDGFLIMLPYGTRADWVKNVLARGSATLVHEGVTHQVENPELVPTASVLHHLSSGDQRAARLFGVSQCLRLRRVDGSQSEPAETPVLGTE